MRLVWARQAQRDTDDIEGYIAQDNPIAALDVRDEIERRVKHLKEYPKLGRVGRVRGTRELVIAGLPYIVVYRLKANVVEIARVLHGAQQWPPAGSKA